METTHGWYDGPVEWIRANKSIRPMNINVDYWPMMFSEQDMYTDYGARVEHLTRTLRPGWLPAPTASPGAAP